MKSNNSFALWPILPFGGEDTDGSNGATDPPPTNPPASNPPASQGNSGTPPPNDDDDDPYAGLSTKELRRLLRDTESSKTATEAEKNALATKLQEQEDAKLTKEQALEKTVGERDTLIATLRATNSKLAIINAIHDDTRFEWNDAEIVAQQLNSSVVKVSDDGKVEGLAKDLARVAKDHEFLLKKKPAEQQQNNDQGPTGFQPGQGGANQGGQLPPNAAELAKTFPALVSRI